MASIIGPELKESGIVWVISQAESERDTV